MTVKKEECLYQGTIKGSDIDTLRLAKSSSSKENCETERMKIDHTLCFFCNILLSCEFIIVTNMHIFPIHEQYVKYLSVLRALYNSSMIKHRKISSVSSVYDKCTWKMFRDIIDKLEIIDIKECSHKMCIWIF